MSCTDAAFLKVFLQELPDTDRYILLLSLADGLTPEEVGLVLDLPRSTVQRRLLVLRMEATRAVERAHEVVSRHPTPQAEGSLRAAAPLQA